MAQGPGTALLLLALASLLKSLAAETPCENIYQGFSDCILRLGENMAGFEEEEDEDERTQAQELRTVCGYWDEFHTCAMTALWECQREAAAVWEMLKRESKKIQFQGSLFDLCALQNSSAVQISHILLLSITSMVTWLNL
ncbi:PREDICTED: neuritin-like [Gekko japonicus]|uniref:Neuritin-like n=1 Tax=Gekko japonicus TaxID=146911 RepID=A0ABM1JWE3_GEKJA|nr:PREDICTED: neuritin-like [Gekko japonicus]